MSTRIVVRSGRSPYQVALVVVSLAAGMLGLALPGPGPSNNIPRVFGDSAPWFYVALLVSSLIVLTGMLWPHATSARYRLSLEIERIGSWPLGGSALAYAATNLAVAGQAAIVSALLTAGIGIAALARVWIITVDLRRVSELLTLEATRGRAR